jgi:DNA-binding MarR family transcriptional regulator
MVYIIKASTIRILLGVLILMSFIEKTHISIEGEVAIRFRETAVALGVEIDTLALMAISGFLNSPLAANLPSPNDSIDIVHSPTEEEEVLHRNFTMESPSVTFEGPWDEIREDDIDFASISTKGEVHPEEDYILWGQFNRFLPIKFTLRMLTKSIQNTDNQSSESLLTMDEWFSDIRSSAPSVRRHLSEIDMAQNTPRGEQLASGFPTFKDKSIARFLNHFCADIYRDGTVVGFPSHLGLIKVTPDCRYVSLTEAGLEYVELHNPVLDGSAPFTSSMSEQESTFMIEQIKNHLPSTWEFMIHVLQSIKHGNCTPDQLSEEIQTVYGYGSQKNWNAAQISTYRTGAIGLLGDMSLIERKRDGRRVSYSLTKNGEEILKNHR